MLVAIIDQTTPSGKVKVRQFREASSESQAVTDFVDSYTPPLTPGDFLGYDTGWGSYQYAAADMQWSYDFDTPGLVETLIPIANHSPVRMENIVLDARQLGYASPDDSSQNLRTSGVYDDQMFDTTSDSDIDKDGRYLIQDTSASLGTKAGGDLFAFSHRRELNSETLHKFKLAQIDDIRFFAGVFNSTAMRPAMLDADDPTVACAGVGYSTGKTPPDTTFRFRAYDGVSHHDIDSGIPVTTDAYHVHVIANESEASFEVRILDRKFVLIARHVFTTNIPAAATNLGAGCALANLVAAVKTIRTYLWAGVNKP